MMDLSSRLAETLAAADKALAEDINAALAKRAQAAAEAQAGYEIAVAAREANWRGESPRMPNVADGPSLSPPALATSGADPSS